MLTRRTVYENITQLGISIGLGILALGIAFFGIVPGITSVQNQYIEVQALKESNENIKNKINMLRNLNEDYLLHSMNILIAAVPIDKAVANSLSTIESIAAETEILLDDFSISNIGSLSTESAKIAQPQSAPMVNNSIRVSVNLSGYTPAMIDFLESLQKARRLMTVSSFSIQLVDSDGNSAAKAKLDLDTYFAPLPKVLGKASDTLEPLSPDQQAMITQIDTLQVVTDIQPESQNQQIQYGNKADPFSP